MDNIASSSSAEVWGIALWCSAGSLAPHWSGVVWCSLVWFGAVQWGLLKCGAG